MYVKSVRFLQTDRCFTKNKKFKLDDITLLVGEQGCGKSTLLDYMNRHDKVLDVILTDLGEQGVETFYFDSEKMNPRTKDPQLYTAISGADTGIGYVNALTSRFASHGEIMVDFTVNCLKRAKNCVIFLDEPESGLSLRNQFRLAAEIQAAKDRKCQLIVATHSLVLIKSVSKVLSLEHGKWMSSNQFIKTQAAS